LEQKVPKYIDLEFSEQKVPKMPGNFGTKSSNFGTKSSY
jgi:hypothetical protein